MEGGDGAIMSSQPVILPYGSETVRVDIPAANLLGVYSPKDVPPIDDVRSEMRRALAHPIRSAPFRELVAGKKKVVLIGDDNTRPTPTDILIPILLDECNAAGVPDRDI